MAEEARGEAHVPAERPSAREASRIPAPHVRSGRSPGYSRPPSQGPSAPVRLIWRIGDKATFAALHRAPRGRCGAVTVATLKPPVVADQPPAVAFAIGRKVGSAVVRNTLRRRLRAISRELSETADGLVRGHFYLVSVRPGAASSSFEELTNSVQEALRRSTEQVARRASTRSDTSRSATVVPAAVSLFPVDPLR